MSINARYKAEQKNKKELRVVKTHDELSRFCAEQTGTAYKPTGETSGTAVAWDYSIRSAKPHEETDTAYGRRELKVKRNPETGLHEVEN